MKQKIYFKNFLLAIFPRRKWQTQQALSDIATILDIYSSIASYYS